jgi:hypothetical protein
MTIAAFLLGTLTGISQSIFFYPLIFFAVLFLCAATQGSRAFVSIATTIVIGALIHFRFPELHHEIMSSPVLDVTALVGYAVIACFWAYFMWKRKLEKIRERFDVVKARHLEDGNLPKDYFSPKFVGEDENRGVRLSSFATDLASEFQFTLDSLKTPDEQLAHAVSSVRPRIDACKTEILLWMTYWPASMLWYAVYDFIAELADAIFKKIKHQFQRLSDKIFADMI